MTETTGGDRPWELRQADGTHGWKVFASTKVIEMRMIEESGSDEKIRRII